MPIIYNLFWKAEAEGISPNSFDEANITLIPKEDKDITRTERKCSETEPHETLSHVLFFFF